MFKKYIIPQNSIILGNSNIVSLSFTEIVKEPSVSHCHPYFELLIPKNNFGILLCNNKKILMQKGTLYIIPSNITHTEINEYPVNKAVYFAIKIPSLIYSDDTFPLVVNIEKEFDKLNTYLSNTYEALTIEDNTFALLNLTCFSHVLNKLLRKRNISVPPTSSPEFIDTSLIKEIKLFFANNYDKEIKIRDVASQYNISQSTLIKAFKKNYRMTPKEYLTKLRFDKAVELLQTSNYTISYIANSCGFLSAAAFIKQFRERFGSTPKEYRNQKNKI